MRFNWRLASVALTLLPLVAATGYTGDKVIQPANSSLELHLVVNPAGGSRTDRRTPFNYGKANLAGVTFNAYDPLAKTVLGPEPLADPRAVPYQHRHSLERNTEAGDDHDQRGDLRDGQGLRQRVRFELGLGVQQQKLKDCTFDHSIRVSQRGQPRSG